MGLGPDQWARVEAVFGELLDEVPDRRRERLAAATLAADERSEVEAMLASFDTPGEFLARPVSVLAAEAGQSLPIGERLGAWKVVRLAGRGGMGEVYEAERVDGQFQQRVAIKLLWQQSPALLQRFQVERQILARLDHPGIARLLDGGLTPQGQPYAVMEYVEGQDLTAFCAARRATVADRLRLFEQICEAVAHAHANLVVHRDLKPSNIQVDAGGRVRLLDFGIAKLVPQEGAPESTVTEVGGRVLTPDYAAPEQISGGPITTATDVYALGVLLFELLSGARPYKLRRGSRAELEEAVVAAEPPRPSAVVDQKAAGERRTSARKLRARLAGDLDTIVLRALKKAPADRYPTVDSLAQDLGRHLRGEPILARRDSVWYRTSRLIRRHRLAFAAAAAVAASLVAATFISVRTAQQARAEARKANAIKDFLLRVFREADNRNNTGDKGPAQTTVAEMLDRGSERLRSSFDDQVDVKLALLGLVADIHSARDQPDRSIALYRYGIELADRSLGPDSAEKAHLLVGQALSEVLAGQFEAGKRTVAEADRVFAARGDHRSVDYATARRLEGKFLRFEGPRSAAAALAALERAADLLRAADPGGDKLGDGLLDLASARLAVDQEEGALSALDELLALTPRVEQDELGWAHALSLRAMVWDRLGDFAAAERDLKAASEHYRRSVGDKHFFSLQNENLRGEALHLSGRPAEGRELLEASAREIAAVRKGSNTHYNTLSRLSAAYAREGDPARALQASEEATALIRPTKLLPRLCGSLLDQARALLALGRLDEAEARAREVVELQQAAPARDPAAVADATVELAAIALARGAQPQAAAAIDEAKALTSGSSRADRRRRVRLALVEARLALARKDPPAALAAVQVALDGLRAKDQQNHPYHRAQVLALQGEALCAVGKAGEGVRALEEALQLRVALLRPESAEIAEVRGVLERCKVPR